MAFTVYPAIDLRGGRVVRLQQGDPDRQTVYHDQPARVAARWLEAGAAWLHVVNLDGAFATPDAANRRALERILALGGAVQFGGGVRSLAAIEDLLALGVRRVVLGTVAVENPDLVAEALARFGAEAIAVGIDARDGRVRTRGWMQETSLTAVALAQQLAQFGLRTVVHTDIARDGVGAGVNVAASRALASATGLEVIASGGVASLEDICRARRAGLAGVVVGRALYEGQIDLQEALSC